MLSLCSLKSVGGKTEKNQSSSSSTLSLYPKFMMRLRAELEALRRQGEEYTDREVSPLSNSSAARPAMRKTISSLIWGRDMLPSIGTKVVTPKSVFTGSIVVLCTSRPSNSPARACPAWTNKGERTRRTGLAKKPKRFIFYHIYQNQFFYGKTPFFMFFLFFWCRSLKWAHISQLFRPIIDLNLHRLIIYRIIIIELYIMKLSFKSITKYDEVLRIKQLFP